MNEYIESAGDEIIVVVDDIKDNVHFLVDILKSEGYTVRPALSGAAALTIMENETPDIVLIDIMMPVMDGYEVCRRIKKEPKHRDIPIIFLSALDDVADKVRGFREGGIDYITKPFMGEEVLARIRAHLSIKRMQADLTKQNIRLLEMNEQLQSALSEIKMLKGILPICANCKKIRDENGSWHSMERYLQTHTDADISHGICPDCKKKLYSEYL